MGQLAHILRMIEFGHFNEACSTKVDVPLALGAVESAIRIDFGDQAEGQ